MKRLLTVMTLAMITFGGFMSPAALAGQTGAVAVEDLVLTIAEGDGWSYSLDASDQPIETMVPMMIDGEPQLDFAPAVLDMYEDYQMLDAYAWSADLLPDEYEPVSTTIEIRAMSFADEENAAGFLDAFYGQLMDLSAPEANVTAIDPLPESDLNMLGVTSMVEFTSYESGESMGSAGSARYLAQIDNVVISVQVTGPLVDYNFDIAYWLLDAQVSCVTEGVECAPVTMPNGDGQWLVTERGIVFQTEGDAENEWARWIFPLEEPVTEPEWSVTIP